MKASVKNLIPDVRAVPDEIVKGPQRGIDVRGIVVRRPGDVGSGQRLTVPVVPVPPVLPPVVPPLDSLSTVPVTTKFVSTAAAPPGLPVKPKLTDWPAAMSVFQLAACTT